MKNITDLMNEGFDINKSAWENHKLKNHSEFAKLEKSGAPVTLVKLIGDLQSSNEVTGIDILRIVTVIYNGLK